MIHPKSSDVAGAPALHRPEFLTEMQVSEYLSVAPATVRKWRMLKKGPPAVKIGFCVRYRQADVDAWSNAQPISGGAAEAN